VTDLVPNEMPASKITISTTTSNVNLMTVNTNYVIRFSFETIDAIALSDYFEV